MRCSEPGHRAPVAIHASRGPGRRAGVVRPQRIYMNDSRHSEMRDEWVALDEAVWTTGSAREILEVWPWESSCLAVQVTWEALTHPKHLADLEYRWTRSGCGASMNEWAAEVTRM